MAIRESRRGSCPLVLAKRERHQSGVMNMPIMFDKVALKRAAPESPSLFAVRTIADEMVVGRTDRYSSPDWIPLGIH